MDRFRSYRYSRGFIDEPEPTIPAPRPITRTATNPTPPLYRLSNRSIIHYPLAPASQSAPPSIPPRSPSRPSVASIPSNMSRSMSPASTSNAWTYNRQISVETGVTHDYGIDVQSPAGSLRCAPRRHATPSPKIMRTESSARRGSLLAGSEVCASPGEYTTRVEHITPEEFATTSEELAVAGLLDGLVTEQTLEKVTTRLEQVQKDDEGRDQETDAPATKETLGKTVTQKEEIQKKEPMQQEKVANGLHINISEGTKPQLTSSGRSRASSPHPDHRKTFKKRFWAFIGRHDDAFDAWLVRIGWGCPEKIGAKQLARKSLACSGRCRAGEDQQHKEGRLHCRLKQCAPGKRPKAGYKKSRTAVDKQHDQYRLKQSAQWKEIQRRLKRENDELKARRRFQGRDRRFRRPCLPKKKLLFVARRSKVGRDRRGHTPALFMLKL